MTASSVSIDAYNSPFFINLDLTFNLQPADVHINPYGYVPTLFVCVLFIVLFALSGSECVVVPLFTHDPEHICRL